MINIRNHLQKDIPYRVKWLNNPKVKKFIGDRISQTTTLKKQKKWFSEYKKDKLEKFFTISDNSKPIGFMGLSAINRFTKDAALFVAIGEDKYRDKGIGKKAMKWLIDYGFKKLKLNRIYLEVTKENIPAVKLYKSLGFGIEKVIKRDMSYRGKFYDTLYMSISNKK